MGLKIVKIIDRVELLLTYVASTALFIMMVLIFADVIGRYLISRPITGVFEITEEYLMIALIFLALSYTWTEGGHIRVDLFVRNLSPGMRNKVEIIFNAIALLLFALIAIQAFRETISLAKAHVVSNSSLAYPLAPSYFLVGFGSSILCLRLIQAIISFLANGAFRTGMASSGARGHTE